MSFGETQFNQGSSLVADPGLASGGAGPCPGSTGPTPMGSERPPPTAVAGPQGIMNSGPEVAPSTPHRHPPRGKPCRAEGLTLGDISSVNFRIPHGLPGNNKLTRAYVRKTADGHPFPRTSPHTRAQVDPSRVLRIPEGSPLP